MAKYIVKQYIAAVGGDTALNSIDSMYAMGKVKMAASEFCTGEAKLNSPKRKMKNLKSLENGEMGGFVLWQKRPELWCLELVVSGCKISAGSDGKVAWRQTPWHHSHASRGPPRPLRRLLQVLIIISFLAKFGLKITLIKIDRDYTVQLIYQSWQKLTYIGDYFCH